MKDKLYRIKNLIERDKMLEAERLNKIISSEVSECLSKFININNCFSKISVGENGGLDVLIVVKANRVKTF